MGILFHPMALVANDLGLWHLDTFDVHPRISITKLAALLMRT